MSIQPASPLGISTTNYLVEAAAIEQRPPMIRRARIACKACNSRRVKCDAADGMPCWHCRTRHTACELIESRRGRYPRQPRGKRRKGSASKQLASTTTAATAREPEDTVDGDLVNRPDEMTADTPVQSNSHGESPAVSVSLLSAEPDEPSRQTKTDTRPSYFNNSLTISYILKTVELAKEAELGPFKADYSTIVSSESHSRRHRAQPTPTENPSLQDALVMPNEHVSIRLIQSFFQNFHPAYPVIDRQAFTSLYRQGQASPLVLHTIYMVAFTCGDEDLVRVAQYKDRTAARKAHYLRAKALYDADYELDDTNLAAALHLLGFWWLGPDDQKDSWYWQGCAVTLAQSLGMHRSLARRDLSPQLRSMWKRIWWSIYIRDRHAAAALGRPCRIRDEDCDIEPPTEDDLLFDANADSSLVPAQSRHHVAYFLEITKLSNILGDIVIGEFSPHRPALQQFNSDLLIRRLEDWRLQLPVVLRSDSPDKSISASFWASMLDASYQSCSILLSRPKKTGSSSSGDDRQDARARIAADAITRIAEDLLASSTLHYAQLHMVPSLFSALSIHSLAMCRKDPILQQLAENKSRQCILALGELAKCWPVRMWIVKSFLNLMRRLNSTSNHRQESIQDNQDQSVSGAQKEQMDQVRTPAVEGQTVRSDDTATGSRDLDQHCRPDPRVIDDPLADFIQPAHLVPDYFSGAADQFVHDSFWLDHLGHGFNLDDLQRELSETLAYPSVRYGPL